MASLSALLFSLSWWLGLYLLTRDPRKPVLVLAAVGLTSFAAVVALDAVRAVSGLDVVSRLGLSLVAAVGHVARPRGRDRTDRRGGRGSVRRCGDGRQRRRACAAWALGDVRRDLAVVAWRDAAGGVRTVAAAAGGGLRRGRDAVLRARARHPRHPARPRAQLAGPGVDGMRRRAARRRGGDV